MTTCAAIALLGSSTQGLAQTCAMPLALNTPSSSPTDSGNTCNGVNELATVCGLSSPAADVIYQISIGASPSATSIVATPSFAFDIAIGLTSSSCSAFSGCTAYVDAAGSGSSEALSLSGIAAGTYYLVLTGTTGLATCGPYTLAANGTLPVQLQGFSIE